MRGTSVKKWPPVWIVQKSGFQPLCNGNFWPAVNSNLHVPLLVPIVCQSFRSIVFVRKNDTSETTYSTLISILKFDAERVSRIIA